MVGVGIMDWLIWGTKNILECIMGRMNLSWVKPILTRLKAFEFMSKPGFPSSVVFI